MGEQSINKEDFLVLPNGLDSPPLIMRYVLSGTFPPNQRVIEQMRELYAEKEDFLYWEGPNLIKVKKEDGSWSFSFNKYNEHSALIDRSTTESVTDIPSPDDILKDFFSLPCEEKSIDRWIEAEDLEKDIEDSKKNLLIVAPPNTGKTSSTLKYLINTRKKFVFLVPLKLQTDQLADDDEYKNYVIKVNKDVDYSKIESDIKSGKNSFISTYNGLEKIIKFLDNKDEYFLIIDEFHKLVTDSNYRWKPIRIVRNEMFNFYKIIGITGTPYGSLDPKLIDLTFKTVKFELKHDLGLIDNYYIIPHNKHSSVSEKLLLRKLTDSLGKGLNIVFKNDKSFIDILKKHLIGKDILKEKEIMVLTSDTKDFEENQKFITDEMVAEGVKLVLTTSVMSTGVNLKNKVSDFFILDEINMIEIIQFIHRPRFGIERVHDIYGNGENSNQSCGLFNDMIKKELSESEKFLMGLKKLVRDHNYKVRDNITNIGSIFYNRNENLFLDRERIIHDVLKKFYLSYMHNSKIRKQYIDSYRLCKTLKIQPISPALAAELDQARISLPSRQRVDQHILFNLLEDSPEQLVTLMNIEKQIPSTLVVANKYSSKFVNSESEINDNFSNRYMNLIHKDNVKLIVQRFLVFCNAGITQEGTLKILQSKDSDKFIMALIYLRLLTLSKGKGRYTKSSNAPLKNEQSFVDFIDELIHKQREHLFLDDLKAVKSNEMFSNSKLKEHFLKAPYEKFKFVYKITRRSEPAGKAGNSGKTYYFVDGVSSENLFNSDSLQDLSEPDREACTKLIKSLNLADIPHIMTPG